MAKRRYSDHAFVHLRYDDATWRVLQDFKKYDMATQKRFSAAINDVVHDILDSAKGRINSATGKLKSSGRTYMLQSGLRGGVEFHARHAHLVEFGHKASYVEPRKRRALHWGDGKEFSMGHAIPKSKGNPFLKPAFEEKSPELTKKLEEALRP